jgi:UDP-N-acetylglucosamine 2-epimerase (non-hydrolysing)
MSTPNVLVCFGTRPEVIKMAPIVERLHADPALSVTTVTTAQHREMLDQMLGAFGIEPDVDLGLMRPRQGLAELTARALGALSEVIEERRPDAVLVQGDTTTAFCAALAGFYADVPVGHVEAGLRTSNARSPFPEEINRRMVAPLARWHFCPTEGSAGRLRAEGIAPEGIMVTGNSVIDALLATAARPLAAADALRLPPKAAARRILVTLHRRETQGEAQRRLCRMLARVAERPDVEIVFPVHLSPGVRESVMAELGGRDGVILAEPFDYPLFVHAMRSSDIIVTDSGGVQEEAPSLGVPVLVMRDTTERPEGIAAGCARLSGTSPDAVERDILELLDDEAAYASMAQVANPYGDGRTAERIVERLRADLSGAADRDLARAA